MPKIFDLPAPMRLVTVMIMALIVLLFAGKQKTAPQKFGTAWTGLGLIVFSLITIGVTNLLLEQAGKSVKLFELPDDNPDFDTMSTKVTLVGCLIGWLTAYLSMKTFRDRVG